MKVIGITGGISSGKSTVSRFLAELGAVIIDADKVGHDTIRSEAEVQQEIIAAFGEQVRSASGEIDRAKLAEIVFYDAESLSRLNKIMHPRMFEKIKTQLEGYRQQGVDVAVLEATLLIEAGWTSLVDEVWVTMASEDTVLKRLMNKGMLSEQQSVARIRSQVPPRERLKHADVVIDTECTLDEVKARVRQLWQKLHT